MLKRVAKRWGLAALRASGAFHASAILRANGQRLLILAFHGISLEDEHKWNPGLYITSQQLRQRLELLRRWQANVLPLNEAIERLQERSLPPRSVTLTFDDGFADFAVHAAPLLRQFRYPATVYLTTYYCRHQLPVFNLAVQYLLWKSNSPEVDLHPLGIPIHSPAADPEQRLAVAAALMNYCDRRQMSSRERDETAAALAATLGIDYERIRRRRLLQILAPEEVTELARTGVDFQLHTHRHRTPFDRELFLREIQDNRRQIAEMTGRDPSHFCYPSGVYARQFLPWLQEAGVRSAVTCELGVAKPAAHLLLLPRLLDDSRVLTLDFEAWLCGLRG